MAWNYWVILSLAAWLLVSPWLLGFSSVNLAVWNNLLVAGLTIIMLLWNFVPPEE